MQKITALSLFLSIFLSHPALAADLVMDDDNNKGIAANGVTSLGYCMVELSDIVKIQSENRNILYRYQPLIVCL